MEECNFQQLYLKDDALALAPEVEKAAVFASVEDLVYWATWNWKVDCVTTHDLRENELGILMRRPFFLLISVDAPVLVRWTRFKHR